jgi:hypothetical protein
MVTRAERRSHLTFRRGPPAAPSSRPARTASYQARPYDGQMGSVVMKK